MKLIQTVLRRPATVFLIILAVVTFGVAALRGMPLEYFPDIDMPMELVLVTWPGTDADSIERLVTEKVEEKCETLSDVNTVSSYTFDSYAMIQLQYNYGVNLDDAYMELKVAMDTLSHELPAGCEDPAIMEISANAIPTMMISVSAEGAELKNFLSDTVSPLLTRLGGVAKVDITGDDDDYLRVVLDEAKLQQYRLSIVSVSEAIAAADFDMPVGNVTIGSQDIAMSAAGDVEVGGAEMAKIPIQTPGGQIVRLEDVASFINLYSGDSESISRYNGNESVLMQITKQNSAVTIDVCDSVLEILDGFAASGELSYRVIFSEADSIKETLVSVVQTLVIGVILTMLVLLLFFGDLKASLIVGCSMPLSILLALILLNQMGFAFDVVTGTALVIAIGMLVDNSIVVLESCMRARSSGLDFREAALKGTREVMMSILAGTITTIVVYVPMAIATGMMGQMASPLSWTIGLTMISSFVCAVIVVPLVFFLAKPVAKEELPINRLLVRFHGFYRRVMPTLLRLPGRVVAVAVAVLALAVLIASQLEFVYFPSDYNGSITVDATFRSGTKLEVMDQEVRSLESALIEDEHFKDVTLQISGNTASFTANSADRSRRSSEEAVEEYTQRFGNVAGMDIMVSPTGANAMTSMMGSGNSVAITLFSDDLDALERGADMVEARMAQVPGVLKINNEFAHSRLQGRLVVDSQKALAVGMTQASIAGQIYYLLNGMTATTVDWDGSEYDIVLEYPEGRYDDLIALLDRSFYSETGAQIMLGDIAAIEYTNSLPSILRQEGQFVTTITATTTAASKYTADDEINAAVAALALPAGVTQGVSAMDQVMEEETSDMAVILLVGIFLVFLVMGIQFNSPRLSIMVMLCIPFSLAGSFALVAITGRPLSLIGLMGFLMLFGIVVNNGILLVDSINALRKTRPLEEAIVEAGVIRLRPILMTTLTTVLSMMPLIFATSSGAKMMSEMAYIIIGGLVAATILTLFMMPPFYLLIRRENTDGTKRKRLFGREKASSHSESIS